MRLFNTIFNVGADSLVQFSRWRGRQAWLVFLIFFGFTLTVFLSTTYSARPLDKPGEIRGVWLTNIDSDVLFQKDNLSNAIETLSQLNFNTLYPTVWNWGYTLYPSKVTQEVIGKSLDPTEGLQNRDILQEIIQQAHQKGMAVIPWFEFGFMAPADSELAKRHPDWLTQRQDGDKIWLEGNVHERVWLNPLQPEVQKFITDLIVEIVSSYDINGIQIDDHFGYPSDFGYDDFTVKLYQKEHNGQFPPQLSTKLSPVNNCVFNDSAWEEWTRWRADKITEYLAQLFQSIKKNNPNVLVSVSPNPQQFSLNCFLSDWQTWERKGLVEELMVQVYRDNMNNFRNELAKAELQAAKAHIPVGIGILSGLKGRPVAWEQIENQVKISREQGFAGVSFFFYESLWNLAQESPTQRQSNFKTLFPTPIQRPLDTGNG
jgi:uncharacterized lipoprotein YddW (UPF0748 family)